MINESGARRNQSLAMMTATSDVSKDAALTIQDDRAVDREAIRAHIDSIFQAFIKKDAAALRTTHAQNWLGYLEGSRTMNRRDVIV
jgi:hypothetical protein